MDENTKFWATTLMVIWIMIIASKIGAHLDKKRMKDYPVKPKEKCCPPHKWRFVEQPGMDKTYFTRCDICNMIPGQEGKV